MKNLLIISFICYTLSWSNVFSQENTGKLELGTPFYTNENLINCYLSPDGNFLLTKSNLDYEFATSIRVWCTNTGKLIRTFSKPGYATYGKFSSSGKYLIITYSSNEMICEVYNLQTGEKIHTLFDSNLVDMSPDDKLYLNCRFNNIFINEFDTNKSLKKLNCSDYIFDITFSDDSKQILIKSENDSVTAYEWVTGAVKNKYKLNRGESLRLGNENDTIVKSKNGKITCQWNHEQLTLKNSIDNSSKTISFKNSKTQRMNLGLLKYIFNDAIPASLRVDTFKKENLYVFKDEGRFQSADRAYPSAFTNDFTMQAIFSDSLSFINVKTGKLISKKAYSFGNRFGYTVFSPDNKFLAYSIDSFIYICNVSTKSDTKILKGHLDDIWSLSFSRDSKYLISGSPDNRTKIWDVQSGKLMYSNGPSDGEWNEKYCVRIALFDNSGNYAASISDNETTILDWKNNKRITLNMPDHSTNYYDFWQFSSDSKKIFGGKNIFDVNTGQKLVSFDYKGSVLKIDWLKGFLYTIYQNSVSAFYLSSGQEAASFTALNENETLINTPDGFFDATKSAMNYLYVVNGFKIEDLENYKKQFYKKDLWKKVLDGEIKPKEKTNKLTSGVASVSDIDGNTYRTFELGNQTWMAEDLKVTQTSDNVLIPVIPDSIFYSTSKLPEMQWQSQSKNSKAGWYNWYTVKTDKICPVGWRVPNYSDLTEAFLFFNENADKLNSAEFLPFDTKNNFPANWWTTDEWSDNEANMEQRTF